MPNSRPAAPATPLPPPHSERRRRRRAIEWRWGFKWEPAGRPSESTLRTALGRLLSSDASGRLCELGPWHLIGPETADLRLIIIVIIIGSIIGDNHHARVQQALGPPPPPPLDNINHAVRERRVSVATRSRSFVGR
jgi:hypothetical protein